MASRTAPRKASRSGSGSGSSTGPTVTQKSTTSSTKPRSPKLRDSCDPCAAAKVRCTKQKPICTRCEKRGIQCEYIVTRRAGRPSQNASRTTTKAMDFSYERQQDEILDGDKGASPSSPPKTTLSEKGFFTSPPMEQQMDICRTYSLPDLHAPCSDSVSDSPSLRCFADEVDSFFATLESLPGLDTSSRDMLNLPNHIDSLNSSANTSANDPMIYDNMIPHTSDYEPPFTEDPCLDMLQLTPLWQTLPQPSSTVNGPAATPPSHPVPCSCLTTALSLIRDFGSSNSSSKAWPHQEHIGAPPTLDYHFPTTTLQSLISSNETVLNTITQILSCPCSQDIYLLTMLSLVVFKVLDRYAAAATMATENNHDHHNSNSKFRSNSISTSSQTSIRHTNSTPSLSPTSFSTTSSTTTSSLPPPHHHHQHQQQQSYQPPPPALPPPYPFTSAPARPNPPTTTTTTTTTTNDGTLLLLLTSDTDPRRVSAQLVLGELHRAQRLVNELSARFRSLGLPDPASPSSSDNHNAATANATADEDAMMMDGTADAGGGATTTANGNTSSSSSSSRPISTTMLEHLEKDLRARVRGVSKGVVELIRRV